MLSGMSKARENRARRAAERRGYAIRKSRVRDPLAVDYGWHVTHSRRKAEQFRTLAELEHWLGLE